MNLDPFNEYTDVDLWDALSRSNLKGVVAADPDQLEALVAENGESA